MMAKETHSLIQSTLTMQEEITILCKGFLRTLKKKSTGLRSPIKYLKTPQEILDNP